MTNSTEDSYRSRINAVFDFVEENIDREITLDDLARVSCFSKYHFSRIFDAVTGESPFTFIRRLRLEKSATLLRIEPQKTITEIALDSGFNDLAVFSRSFRDYFGSSPSQWRKKSNKHQTRKRPPGYVDLNLNRNQQMEQLQFAEVRDLPDQTMAYIRHIGPYAGDEALFNRLFSQLFEWAGYSKFPDKAGSVPHVIYHDDPCITDEDKLRMSVCLPVSESTLADDRAGVMKLKGGRFLMSRFSIEPENMPGAWKWIYGKWLPTSGYQPADRLAFERYPDPPKNGKLTVDICVPVKPLQQLHG